MLFPWDIKPISGVQFLTKILFLIYLIYKLMVKVKSNLEKNITLYTVLYILCFLNADHWVVCYISLTYSPLVILHLLTVSSTNLLCSTVWK